MSKKLIATRGLPASGKSSWAAEEKARLEAHNLKVEIVNKDDIRNTLVAQGWVWSNKNEQDVKNIQVQTIKDLFAAGYDVVISSDTNFGSHKERLQQLAKACGAEFEVKDFTKVDVNECIRRDRAREKKVGEAVIRDMYAKYLALPEVIPYVPDTSKPKAFLVDIDGTVALMCKRSPYDLSKVGQDKLNTPVANAVHSLYRFGWIPVYCSGRDDSCKEDTVKWILDNGLPWAGLLHMRKTGDNRKDFIVKQELFDQNIRDNYNVQLVLDDRDQVVKMWRRLGLTCLQVGEGDF